MYARDMVIHNLSSIYVYHVNHESALCNGDLLMQKIVYVLERNTFLKKQKMTQKLRISGWNCTRQE